MANLSTSYLGIELRNPILVGASNLVTDVQTLKELEQSGAGAIVYKSLFEEQIQLENLQMSEQLGEYENRNAEMVNLFPDIEHAGPKEFLMNLKKARQIVSIPLIASLNAVWEESWVEYACQLEKTGVDALELNFYAVPKDPNIPEKDIVEEQTHIIRQVVKEVRIPVSVKISPFYTNTLAVLNAFENAGAKGFVLFNKLFQPDIDIQSEKHFFPYQLSHPEDNRLGIRFAGLLFGNTKADVCANSGIYEGEDVIKLLLAGSGVVQVVSTLYKNKPAQIQKILQSMDSWMESKGYHDLASFRGKLSKNTLKDSFAYKRAQYVDILMKSDEIFRKYPLR